MLDRYKALAWGAKSISGDNWGSTPVRCIKRAPAPLEHDLLAPFCQAQQAAPLSEGACEIWEEADDIKGLHPHRTYIRVIAKKLKEGIGDGDVSWRASRRVTGVTFELYMIFQSEW